MQRITRDKATHFEIGAHHAPGITVDLGETFVIETKDNWSDVLGEHDEKVTKELPSSGSYGSNPVGGPVFIRGVDAGDTLVVDIKDIAVRDWGWTGTLQSDDLTSLGLAALNDNFWTVIRHEPGPSGTLSDGQAVLDIGRRVTWPLAPFLGVIATAPGRGTVENTVITQGAWGGNVDVRDVCKGSRIFMNASHAGGLLFVGDVHASQGDSELTGLGNETAADVVLTCDVIKGRNTPGVFRIEKADSLIQVDSARRAGTVERALSNIYLQMKNWLVEDYNMSAREAYIQMSANSLVRTHVYQCVSGYFTCGVEFPKSCL